tara:strand:- start:455 stop:1078 length:624 start_codon:yes stop_codon:yes gene_type:complete
MEETEGGSQETTSSCAGNSDRDGSPVSKSFNESNEEEGAESSTETEREKSESRGLDMEASVEAKPEERSNDENTEVPLLLPNATRKKKTAAKFNIDIDKVFEGMVIVLGFLHCILRVNPFAAACLLFFLYLKAKGAPKFFLTALFTLLALVCPTACAEVALLLLDPPIEVCQDISNGFRNSAAGLERRVEGGGAQQISSRKETKKIL